MADGGRPIQAGAFARLCNGSQLKQPSMRREVSGGGGKGTVPLYHRVYLLLLQGISDRTFPPERPMPTEAELSLQLGVSRITLRTALQRLEHEGLVSRQRGRGTFPLPASPEVRATPGMGLRNQATLALKTGVRLVEHAVVKASPAVAGALGVSAGEDVLRIVRVRHDAASPISFSDCHVPVSLASFLPKRRLRTLPISTILASAGLSLETFREQLSACIADMATAELLDVDVGSALMSLVRTVRIRDGQVVEHLRVLYRPDRFEYNVEYSGSDANDPSSSWRAKVGEQAS